MTTYMLGIDIGTSACKVALFLPDGKVVAQASGQYPTFYPNPGWFEQNPEDWWQAVCVAIKEILYKSKIAPGDIAGVGIDGQSWSAIPVDSKGNVLCNTPIWMDTRAEDICKDLERSIGSEPIFSVCGNPLQPGYTLPKMLWYKKYRPDLYKNVNKILQSNSYIAYRLTDVITQDISQSYGLHCFNMRKGNWDDAMCIEMGVRKDLLPEIVACHSIIGSVTEVAAKQCGLAEGTPVVAGGLDAACGTLGAGVLHNGEAQEQGGQAGGMSICIESYHADPRLVLGYHVIPDKWLLQGGTVGGGGVMRWFEQQFGAVEKETSLKNGTSSLYEMDALAEDISAGSEGLIFLPYMAGERSPIWNPHAKGVYYGVDFSKTRAHMIRASMEGVAYSLRHNLEVAEDAGVGVTKLRATGGAANSRLWTQIKSDVTGKEINIPYSDTATTLGAAMLAGVATGIYKDFNEAVTNTVRITRCHKPNKKNYEVYNDGFRKYLDLYNNLKPLMNQ